jgi:hypothetical protein
VVMYVKGLPIVSVPSRASEWSCMFRILPIVSVPSRESE